MCKQNYIRSPSIFLFFCHISIVPQQIVTKLKIRESIIEDAKKDMEKNISTIDLEQLRNLYNDTKLNISNIQKTFEDLVNYHNEMLMEKSRYISLELPKLSRDIREEEKIIERLLLEEKSLSIKIAKGDSFEELENIISDLNELYRKKGEYEGIVLEIEKAEKNILLLNEKLKNIDSNLFSENFRMKIKSQVDKFNNYFSKVSSELYGEKYLIKFEKVTDKNNKKTYKFSSINMNMSTGKKQGEIISFDIAYIMFADSENIPSLHFLLNDKKELMHHNQLYNIKEFIKDKNIQIVFSILRDKLPLEIIDDSHIAVTLSQSNKLFKIENMFDN